MGGRQRIAQVWAKGGGKAAQLCKLEDGTLGEAREMKGLTSLFGTRALGFEARRVGPTAELVVLSAGSTKVAKAQECPGITVADDKRRQALHPRT